MARSIDPQPKAARGFIPARTDEERYLMRHIEDLAHTAFSRDIARYSAFLSDREQDLARAALGRAGVQESFRFEGGWLNAERRVLCIEPEYSCGEAPICCVRLQCCAQAGAALPAHKRVAKSRSPWIYPSFQNTKLVFCGDWDSAPTSMKQAGSV